MPVIIRDQDIERVVAANPAEESLAMNYFRTRQLKNSTQISIAEIKQEYGNVPVIRRGGVGVRPASGMSIGLIEPQPVELDGYLSAVEMDEYERATNAGRQQIIDERLASFLRIIRTTTRALCAQACRGSIDYMMQAGTTLVRYEVDYGTVTGVSFPETLATLTLAQVFRRLQDLTAKIRASNVGGPVEFIASDDVFGAIVEAAGSQKSIAFTLEPGAINVGGFKIFLNNDSWIDVSSAGVKTTKTMVESNEILALATNAGQKLCYLRIDDTVMRSATPFYSFTKERDDQRGTNIYAKSKPFPLPNVKGIAIGKFAS